MLMRFTSQKQTREKTQMELVTLATQPKDILDLMINLFSEMFHSPKTVNNFIADCNETLISALNLKPHICIEN